VSRHETSSQYIPPTPDISEQIAYQIHYNSFMRTHIFRCRRDKRSYKRQKPGRYHDPMTVLAPLHPRLGQSNFRRLGCEIYVNKRTPIPAG
jgi:hypothetical protein